MESSPKAPSIEDASKANQAATLTLLNQYEAVIRKAGYEPTIPDTRNFLMFKRENLHFVILPEGDDPSYFRLALPGIYKCQDEAAKVKAFAAMVRAGGDIKAAKLVMINDSVCVTVEMFVPSVDYTESIFARCIDCILRASGQFMNAIDGPVK
jgi:hypothetical protein